MMGIDDDSSLLRSGDGDGDSTSCDN